MQKIQLEKLRTTILVLISGLMLILSACSNGYRSVYQRPTANVLPKIPELKGSIKQRRARSQTPRRVVRKAPAKPPKRSGRAVAKISKHPVRKATAKAVITSKVETVDREALKIAAKKRATIEFDPYAVIPDNGASAKNAIITSTVTTSSSIKPIATLNSPAVNSLLTAARSDLTIGRTQAAVSKLERGLRIESQNPQIWYLLSKAHYNMGDYQQTINMAKKSIRYASDDKLISQSWTLIKKAGEKAQDTLAIKAARDYFRVNP